MAKLYPPLEDIEDRLFSPSDHLIERWVNKDPSLRESVIVALEADSQACERRQLLLLSMESQALSNEVSEGSVAISDAPVVSRFLAEMIERRVSTQSEFTGVLETAPGQICLIDRALGPDDNDLGWDINHPLAVLLLRETGDNDLWYGWMVSGEPDYASYWDVLLEEGDEPYDPLVAMVQLWNPVRIYANSLGRVLGRMSTDRIEALTAAYGDFRTGERPDPAYARPGTLVDRLTSSGVGVLTGTPTGLSKDPRRRYQELYFSAAGLLKEMAGLAVQPTSVEHYDAIEAWADLTTSWAQAVRARLLQNLNDFASSLGRTVQAVNFAGAQSQSDEGTKDAGSHWNSVSGLFEQAVMPSPDGTSVRLLMNRIDGATLTVRLKLDERLLQEHFLNETYPSVEFNFEPEPGLMLEVEDLQGVKGSWKLSM